MTDDEWLYHYTTPGGLIGIVSSNCLWATDALYLDDAHELAGGIALARRQLQEVASGTTDDEQRARIAWLLHDTRDLGTPRLMSTFVCSLSSESDLLSQWRSYCPEGGFAIGFPAGQLREAIAHQQFVLSKCRYAEADHQDLIRQVIDRTALPWVRGAPLPVAEDQARFEVSGKLVYELVRTAALLKHPSFAAEREYRIVSEPGLRYDPNRRFFRAKRGLVVPYTVVELPDSIEFWGRARITVGPSPHPEHAKRSVYGLVRRYRGHAVAIEVTRSTFRNW
jgi:hypothetical protein